MVTSTSRVLPSLAVSSLVKQESFLPTQRRRNVTPLLSKAPHPMEALLWPLGLLAPHVLGLTATGVDADHLSSLPCWGHK